MFFYSGMKLHWVLFVGAYGMVLTCLLLTLSNVSISAFFPPSINYISHQLEDNQASSDSSLLWRNIFCNYGSCLLRGIFYSICKALPFVNFVLTLISAYDPATQVLIYFECLIPLLDMNFRFTVVCRLGSLWFHSYTCCNGQLTVFHTSMMSWGKSFWIHMFFQTMGFDLHKPDLKALYHANVPFS